MTTDSGSNARARSGEMESVRAAYSVCSLPPCGGGLGRGVARFGNAGASISRPPPPTPPHKGEGSTASVRYIFGSNTTKRAHGSLLLVEVRPRPHMQAYEDVDAARLRHWNPPRDRAGDAGCTRTLSLSWW